MKNILTLYRDAFSNLQRNVWILSAALFINRSGSMVLLFMSLYFTKELHFTIGQAGLVMSCFGIGSVLGSYAGGWLADRKDYFGIMIVSLIVSGCILLTLLFARNAILVSAIIFTYAFMADMFRPAHAKAIATYTTDENRTRSVSLVRLAVNLGFSIGPAIGGFVAVLLGYHWLFVIDALTSFAAALMIYLYLPPRKTERSAKSHEVLGNRNSSAYRDVPYLIFILLVALYGLSFFQLFASVPQYFNQICGYNEDTIGLLLGLNGLLVVLIEMPVILLLEKKKKVFRLIIVGTLCTSLAFAFLLFGKGMMLWAIIYTFVLTMSEIFAMPFMMNIALSRPEKERQGQYSALYSIAYGLSNIAAPLVGLGIAEKFGFNRLFEVLIVIGLLTSVGFYGLGKRMKLKSKV